MLMESLPIIVIASCFTWAVNEINRGAMVKLEHISSDPLIKSVFVLFVLNCFAKIVVMMACDLFDCLIRTTSRAVIKVMPLAVRSFKLCVSCVFQPLILCGSIVHRTISWGWLQCRKLKLRARPENADRVLKSSAVHRKMAFRDTPGMYFHAIAIFMPSLIVGECIRGAAASIRLAA